MSEKVIIDEDECIGCETCVELCPAVFRFDDELTKAVVIDGADPDADGVEDAIASCPAACIRKE